MTEVKEISAKDISVQKFLEACKSKIEETMIEYPNNYIEVDIMYCIGKRTNASCRIDIEESEMEQTTKSYEKRR